MQTLAVKTALLQAKNSGSAIGRRCLMLNTQQP